MKKWGMDALSGGNSVWQRCGAGKGKAGSPRCTDPVAGEGRDAAEGYPNALLYTDPHRALGRPM